MEDFEDIIDNHFIPTNSLIFRNGLIKDYSLLLSPNMISGDIPLELMLASHGKLKYLYDEMAVKRINGGGITANRKRRKKSIFFKYELYYQLNKYTKGKYKTIIYPKIFKSMLRVVYRSLLNGDFRNAIKYFYYYLKAIVN